MKKNIIFIFTTIFVLLSVLYYEYRNYTNIENIEKQVQIVYYGFLNTERWRHIILPQMEELRDCGLLDKSDILIVLCGDKHVIEEAEREIRGVLSTYIDRVKFSSSYENLYEYPGIKAMHDMCTANPEKVYLYFHSKGMIFNNDNNVRNPLEKLLTKKVVLNYKNILNVFESHPNINKVSYGCTKEGACWYNFFWVKGNYVAELPSPQISNDRFYYEHYLGNGTHVDCYNLAERPIKPYYTSEEITQSINTEVAENV